MRLMTRILLAGDALAVAGTREMERKLLHTGVYGVARARARARERALGEIEIIGSNTL
jgi:hypothetical protein